MLLLPVAAETENCLDTEAKRDPARTADEPRPEPRFLFPPAVVTRSVVMWMFLAARADEDGTGQEEPLTGDEQVRNLLLNEWRGRRYERESIGGEALRLYRCNVSRGGGGTGLAGD